MASKKRKNQLEHYTTKEAFFNDANYSRKAIVKCKLRGMSRAHVNEWAYYLARRNFNGGSEGFTFTPQLISELWEHYNAQQ